MTSIPSFSSVKAAFRPARRPAAATGATADGHERLWLPLGIVAAALVALAGWMVLVSPLRADTAALDSQTATVTQQVDTLRSQLSALQAGQAKLPAYRSELQTAQAALPTTAALLTFLRTLQDLGTKTGTSVTGLNATAPDGTIAAAGNRGVGNVYEVPISVTVKGRYAGLTAFVAALQGTQPRAVLVTSVNAVGATGGDITLTITMTAFVAPTAGATTNGG